MHVVVYSSHAFHNNHNDLSAFTDAFKEFLDSKGEASSIRDSIDWKVYSRNRNMRCLGNFKCLEPERPFVRAMWHIPSGNAASNEFYITNIASHVKLLSLDSIASVPKRPAPNVSIKSALSKNLKFQTTSPHFSDDQRKTAEILKDAAMDIFRESEVSGEMAEQFEATSLVPLEGGVRVLLTRKASGRCILCKRVHDSDNAFLQINLLGKIFYSCRRNHRKRELVGRLKGENKIQERDLVSLSVGEDFNADEEYSERFLKYCHIRKSLVIKSGTGTSVDFNVENKVDYVVGYFNTYSGVDAESCIQMLRRARYPKEKTYLVHMNDRFSNLPVESKDIEDWLCDQDRMIRDGPKDAEHLDVKIMQNLSKNDFVGRFISFIKEAGGKIQGIDEIESDHDIVSLTQDIQEFQTQIQTSENEKMAAAPDIGILGYEALKNRKEHCSNVGKGRDFDFGPVSIPWDE
ncbi:hypothetical protein BGX26_003248 [Mortierella sp. AD094]|nr:hypothetical protein BGX26_003248 [Mortierella sp. AD094]